MQYSASSSGPCWGATLVMARSLKAPHILELGTSYGYSTIWLAEAARAAGGRVTSIELQDYKSAYAHDMAVKAGLADHVDFRIGDAQGSARLGQDVPRPRGIRLDLGPQVRDVHVQVVRLVLVGRPPDRAQQRVVGQQAPLALSQDPQQVELVRAELDPLAGPGDGALRDVDPEVSRLFDGSETDPAVRIAKEAAAVKK